MKRLVVFLIACLASPATASANTTAKINQLHGEIIRSDDLEVIPEIKRAPKSVRRELLCLSLNIYHEARGSTSKDQWGVALVTLNRLSHRNFGDTVCQVVWERRDAKKAPQFSWTAYTVKRLTPEEPDAWTEAQRIAYLAHVDEDMHDFTNGSLHYYNPKLVKKTPVWVKSAVAKKRIGKHVYMKLASNR